MKKSALRNLLKIINVPTFIFYHNGKELNRFEGANKNDLINNLNQLSKLNQTNIKPKLNDDLFLIN